MQHSQLYLPQNEGIEMLSLYIICTILTVISQVDSGKSNLKSPVKSSNAKPNRLSSRSADLIHFKIGTTQNKKYKIKARLGGVTKKITPLKSTRLKSMRQNDYDTLNYDPFMFNEPPIIQDGKTINVPARPPGFTYYPKRGISQAPTATMPSATTTVTKISRNRKKFAYLVLPDYQEIIIPFPPGSQFWPKSQKPTPTSHVTFDIDPTHSDKDENPTNRGRISRDEKKFTTPGGAASAAVTTQQPNREQQVAQSEAPFMTAPPPSRPISAPRANDANEGEKMITNLVTTEPTQLAITPSASAPTAFQLTVTGDNSKAPAGETEISKGPAETAADVTMAPNDNDKFKFTVAVTQGYVFNDEAYTGTINLASSATRKAAVTSRDGEMFKAFGGLGSLFNQFIPGG